MVHESLHLCFHGPQGTLYKFYPVNILEIYHQEFTGFNYLVHVFLELG